MTGDGVDAAVLAVLSEARPEKEHAHERGPSAHAMHDRGTGEIVEAHSTQPAAAPDPMSGDGVHERYEQGREQDIGLELDALGHGARHNRRGGGGEHELKEELRLEGHARPCQCGKDALVTRGIRQGAVVGARQEETLQSKQCSAVAEHQPETRGPERERCDGEHDEVLGENVDRVF